VQRASVKTGHTEKYGVSVTVTVPVDVDTEGAVVEQHATQFWSVGLRVQMD